MRATDVAAASLRLVRSRRPRRLHLLGVGIAKSGTHSLASVFARSYRAQHEPDDEALLDLLIARHEGRAGEGDLRRWLRARDWRRRLEVDSSSLNAAVLPQLLALHPKARFVLTVRPPRPWLQSITDHTLGRGPASPGWERWRAVRFGGVEPTVHDGPLLDRGLFPLRGYVGGWARHNQEVLSRVERDRLLVLETSSLARRLPELSAFAGVGEASLDAAAVHSFPAASRHNALDALDPAYVDDTIEEMCGPLVAALGTDQPVPGSPS